MLFISGIRYGITAQRVKLSLFKTSHYCPSQYDKWSFLGKRQKVNGTNHYVIDNIPLFAENSRQTIKQISRDLLWRTTFLLHCQKKHFFINQGKLTNSGKFELANKAANLFCPLKIPGIPKSSSISEVIEELSEGLERQIEAEIFNYLLKKFRTVFGEKTEISNILAIEKDEKDIYFLLELSSDNKGLHQHRFKLGNNHGIFFRLTLNEQNHSLRLDQDKKI
ncbi:hypothetical protein ACFL52_00645 [Candidatus Margulisiibacteriota bacterium]